MVCGPRGLGSVYVVEGSVTARADIRIGEMIRLTVIKSVNDLLGTGGSIITISPDTSQVRRIPGSDLQHSAVSNDHIVTRLLSC